LAGNLRKKFDSPKIPYPVFIILVISLVLAGCTSLPDPEVAQVYHPDNLAVLGPSPDFPTALGQSFQPQRNHLDSLTIWLSTTEREGQISQPTFLFQLFEGSDSTGKLSFEAFYRLPSPNFNGPFRITFPALAATIGKTYFFLISKNEGSVAIKGRIGDFYPNGQAQVDGRQIAGDASFSVTYRYGFPEIGEDAGKILRNFWIVFPAGILILLPGWLILDLLRINERYRFWERVALSAGFSLAVIPIFMVTTHLAGLHWNLTITVVCLGSLGALAIYRFFHQKPWKQAFDFQMRDAALTGILALSLFVRVAMVRDLVVPPWVDSVHHALVTRQIQEQGGIPIVYEPDLGIQQTSYHPGYHATLALFQWISGFDLPLAMLVFGQILNTLAVISAYLFTSSLTRNPWAGVCAALVAGLVTPLPAYLTSWGRYTHLAGLIILAGLVSIFEKMVEAKSEISVQSEPQPNNPRQHDLKSFHWIIASSLGVAGLSLVHYRMTAFLGLWMLAIILTSANKKGKLADKIKTFITILTLSLLINLPWAISAITNTFLPRINTPAGASPTFFSDFDLSILTAASGWIALCLAGTGIILLAIRSTRLFLTMLLWICLMFFIANLSALGLPGGYFVNTLSVEITLYLPISLSAGFAIAWIVNSTVKIMPIFLQPRLGLLLGAGLTTVSGIGFLRLLPILNPATVLAHHSDLEAIQWINTNIAKEEAFLINPLPWGEGLCIGNDGGYWITPLAGNLTYPPPLLYGLGETQTIEGITGLCDRTRLNAQNPGELFDLMRANGIRYVYLGSKGGVLSPTLLSESEYFELIYKRAGVWIFDSSP
jgi:hypothetical protein